MRSAIISRTLFKTYITSIVCTPNSCPSKHIVRNKHKEPKYIFNMNEVFVRYIKDSDTFDVTFRFIDPNLNVDRQFNFTRRASETVDNFLRRIDTNVSKTLQKKAMRRKKKLSGSNQTSTVEDELPLETDNVSNNNIMLLKDDQKVDGQTACESILNDSSNLTLVLFGTKYIVKQNAPYVIGIALPSSILVGFPTYPSKFETVFTDQLKSKFVWYKEDLTTKKKNVWSQTGEGYLYTPSTSDIGCKLKLHCIPRNDKQEGPAIEVESKVTVEAGPGQCPFETRHAFTTNRLTGKSFRIVSYNILADTYADSDYSKETLFPYCPQYALAIDYRKQLILKEVIGFNADIICLQEVDSKIFRQDLMPTLSSLHYDGIYNTKNEMKEGIATFFNQERFKILDFENTVLGQNTDFEKFHSVWTKIKNENVKTRFSERNTTIQVTVLQSTDNPSEILVVGNTHLYFRPDADNIRLLQGYYALTYVYDVATKTKAKNPDSNVSIILCGDFNSTPDCGIYQLMTKNYVPEDCIDWRSKEDEVVDNISLSHDLQFSSACGTPQYTNYTPEFSGCLDYIFYQTDRLEVEQVIPMPSAEEVTLHIGLPSVVFPSDHISLCADLKWNI